MKINNKKIKKINFEVKRVYVGKKPIGEIFYENSVKYVKFFIIITQIN